jgi:hypothetical protein
MTILLSETHKQLVTFGMVKIYEYCVYLNIRWEFCPNWLCEKFRGAFKSWLMLNILCIGNTTELNTVKGDHIICRGILYWGKCVKNVSLTNEDVWCQWLIIVKNNQEGNQLYRNGTVGQVHSLICIVWGHYLKVDYC